jgi:hypothetical protein
MKLSGNLVFVQEGNSEFMVYSGAWPNIIDREIMIGELANQ